MAGLQGWAYGFLFLAAVLETVPALGILVPGQVIVVAAGAAASLGYLDVWLVFGLTAFGAILGDAIGYEAGRRGGTVILARYGKSWGLEGPRLISANVAIQKQPGLAIIGGRFNSVTRAFIPFVAGSLAFPRGRFFVYNVVGGIIWSGSFTILGYVFGESYHAAEDLVNRVGIILVLALVGGYVAWRISREVGRRLQSVAATSGGLVFGGVALGFLGPLGVFGWGCAAVGALLAGVVVAVRRARRVILPAAPPK